MSIPVRIAQWPTALAVEPGQTILQAALEEGVPYPHGCRSGNCGACKSRLQAGEVELEGYSTLALDDAERAGGLILACRAVPLTPVEVAWLEGDEDLVAHPLRKLLCTVRAVEPLTHDIKRILVALPPGERLAFSAGQYASLTFPGQAPRDYSMANRPDEPGLEFHVRAMPNGSASHYVFHHLAPGEPVRVEGPFGSSHLRENHRGPIIAIAGGSGLAPIKSIVETALDAGMPQRVHLYVGVRDERDLYMEDRFRALAAAHPQLTFTPVLSEPSGPTQRRTGLVHTAVGRDYDDLDGCKAYVAGPPAMVDAAIAMLEMRDMRREDIHADAFYTEADKAALGR